MALESFVEIPIEEIKIKKRLRAENKGIEELAASIEKYGLLNPIIVGTDKTLIAGYRRLLAVKLLGGQSIEARIVEIKDAVHAVELEIEENTRRCQFSEEEIMMAMNKLNKLKRPNIFIRILNKLLSFFNFSKK